MRSVHAGAIPAPDTFDVDPQPGPCGPATHSNDNTRSGPSLQATACGRLAVSMPVGLRYGRFLTLALALGELHAGVLMIASFEAGHAFGGGLLSRELEGGIELKDVAATCKRQQENLKGSYSDAVAAVNFYIQAMSYDEQQLLENGISWLQVKCFVDAVVHIVARLLDYIVENFPPLRYSCGEQLSKAV